MQNYHLGKLNTISHFFSFPAILCFFACSNLDIVRNETTHEDYVSQGDGVNDNAASTEKEMEQIWLTCCSETGLTVSILALIT